MTRTAVSVIVVSRHRPDALVRCLAGLEQQDHDRFEIIVVADPGALARLSTVDLADRVKTVAHDVPNISAARNLGLAAAAGRVVAFIDDDAVPEPTWLRHLVAPFRDPSVKAAGGYVLGRNGISFQNRGRRVDAAGAHTGIRFADDAPVVLEAQPGCAVKTEGTNCAFRAETLRAMGGFDPVYRFYLDETDVNLRLAARRASTAVVPLAQVHHGFAASDRRLASRVPTSLHEIGASLAVFLRRHSPDGIDAGLQAMRVEQRLRLLRFMVAGLCDPRDVGRLLATLEGGVVEGLARPLRDPEPLPAGDTEFLPFEGRIPFHGMEVLVGRPWQRNALRRKAEALIARGRRATVYLFGLTARYHVVRFHPSGFWEQSGGQFGRSTRNGPLFQGCSMARRVVLERRRTQETRELTRN